MDFLGFLAVILLIINLDCLVILLLFDLYKKSKSISVLNDDKNNISNNDFWE